MPYLPDFIHVFALTMRGSGDQVPPGLSYLSEDFTADLLMFMDKLRIEKAVILGASSGGFVARRFAAQYPQRTLALVLFGSPAKLSDKPAVRETIEKSISKMSDPVDPEFVRDFNKSMIAKSVPEDFFQRIITAQMKIPAQVWIEVSRGPLAEDFPGDIREITAPTLIIWGDQDAIVTRAEQEALSQAIPDSRLIVHSGSGHVLYWEEPDRVAADILSFVQGNLTSLIK